MKRIISVLIGVCLAAGLFVPVMAADEPDPNMPIITWVHSNPYDSYNNTIAKDKTLLLEIKAELPEGSEGELSIEWFVDNTLVATGPRLEAQVNSIRDNSGSSFNVRLVVTNSYTDEDSSKKTETVTDNIRVYVEMPWWTGIADWLLAFGLFFGIPSMYAILISPILIPMRIFQWIGDLLFGWLWMK